MNYMNNGRRHTGDIKAMARDLRIQGKTHREITKMLGVSLGSAHLWSTDIKLTDAQKEAVRERYRQHAFTLERRENLSKQAIRLAPYQYQQIYTKDDLLEEIKSFYKENGRIPLKREFNRRIFREYFGSWNNAIRLAGFDQNPVLFAKKFTAVDGHKCDSFSEKIIDDWLCEKGIKHGRHVSYGKTKMTADFTIGDVRIEFFGLAGEQIQYDKTIQRKRAFCAQETLWLIEIYPSDLYSKTNSFPDVLSNKLSEVFERNVLPTSSL